MSKQIRSALEPDQAAMQVAQQLRRAREERGLTLRDLARRLAMSPSALSQIETGKSQPSVKTLYVIVTELGLSMDQIFTGPLRGFEREPSQDGSIGAVDRTWVPPVQDPADRPRIDFDTGVSWERLTPGHDPDVDFLQITYPPGSVSDRLVRRSGTDYGVVISGELELTVGFETFLLKPGASCSFDSSEPNRLANPGSEPATAIWFVTGHRPLTPARR